MNNSIKQKIKYICVWLSIGICILQLTACQNRNKTTYSVKKVSDGDTLNVYDSNNNKFTVRFACVDAPEIPHSNAEKSSKKSIDKNQFKWGIKAQQRLQQLVEQGNSRVSLKVTDTDRYGRKVSEVTLPDGTLVQEVLAKEGLVMVYTPYLKNCPSADIIQQAQNQAQQSKIGVWSDSKFMPPWQYRKEIK